jgi:methylated-DNA-[protein]-cysteine S-methyltransferase
MNITKNPMKVTNDFTNQCYELLKKIPKGRVTTYKIIAEKLGKKCYRLIGQIMAKNPNAPKVPCHRVVKSDGQIGGYMGSLKSKTNKKIELLKQENVAVDNNKIVDFKQKIYHFKK